MMDQLRKSVFLAEASDIVGASPKTLQNWIKRDYVTAKRKEEIEGGDTRGRNFRFSFIALIELAIANEFVKLGIAPSRAFGIAVEFAHVGGGGFGWVECNDPNEPERNPSLPFHYALGDTYICANEDEVMVMLVRKGENPLGKYPIMLDVWPTYARVVVKLGGQPFELLDSIYGKHPSGFDEPKSAEGNAG